MTPPKGWKRSFHFDRYGRRLEESLDEELHFHLTERVERLMQQGLTREEAMSEARRLMGDINDVRSECSKIDTRSSRYRHSTIGSLMSDLRYALRTLRSEPLFTGVVILILAIGIGATTAMFSTVNAVLLHPLPFVESDRLVMFQKIQRGNVSLTVSGHDFFDYDDQCRSYSSLAMLLPFINTLRVEIDGEVERIQIAGATWDFFSTLGVEPAVGRFFTETEADPEDGTAVVISYAYWQERFGGAASAIGTALATQSSALTIVGVLPAGFRFMADADAWILLFPGHPRTDNRMYHNFAAIGRLAPGVSIEQAQEEINVISANLAVQYPDTNEDKGVVLTELQQFMVTGLRASLLLLMGTVVLVLLIACGNVAGLLLARGQTRQSELAVRSAIGATRRRLVSQLLVESVIVALLAGVLGVAIAVICGHLLMRLLPLDQLGVSVIGLDVGMLIFALLLSLVTGLVFGILPAIRTADVDPARQLQSGSRTTSGGRSSRLRSALVSLQVALAIILLIGSGLLIRSLQRQMTVDLGFRTEGLLTAELDIPAADYPAEARVAVFRTLKDRIEVLPGVESMALVTLLPILQPLNTAPAYPSHNPPVSNADASTAFYRVATPEYFSTMSMPIITGRTFSESDGLGAPLVAVINERLAWEWYADMNPLGRGLTIILHGNPVEYEIVGVVADARLAQASWDPFRAIYVSQYQRPPTIVRLVVRTTGDPAGLVPAVRDIIRDIDRQIIFAEQQTMETIVRDSMRQYRIITTSMSLFAGLALLLTAIGLYGVLAYYVSQRRGELGVRVALGANRVDVVSLILKRGMLLVGIGLVPGIAGAAIGSHLLQQLLFETYPLQLSTYGAASLFLLMVAFCACLIPAWRASILDPASFLQAE